MGREIERIRDEEVPHLYATDPHSLRVVNETKSIVLVAEMHRKSRLLREESQEGCLREDFPDTDNVNWLKWSMLEQDNEKMKLWTGKGGSRFPGDPVFGVNKSKLQWKIFLAFAIIAVQKATSHIKATTPLSQREMR